jgi:hypothetical protein
MTLEHKKEFFLQHIFEVVKSMSEEQIAQLSAEYNRANKIRVQNLNRAVLNQITVGSKVKTDANNGKFADYTFTVTKIGSKKIYCTIDNDPMKREINGPANLFYKV